MRVTSGGVVKKRMVIGGTRRPFVLLWVEESEIAKDTPTHQPEFWWPTMKEIKKLALKEK